MYNAAAAAKSLQSCPTLCDPIDASPPGSLVPGILQARTLEWVAISFSNNKCIFSPNASLSHFLFTTLWLSFLCFMFEAFTSEDLNLFNFLSS